LRLVGDASAFDRAMRELPDHEMALLEFENVLKDALSGVTALAVSQGIGVSVTVPEELPAVWGNHDQLLQVFYNLLLNALKFTPRGGSVWVEVQLTEGEVVTTVADTGRGIAPLDLKEILAQAERPELFLPLKGRRVGLGLAIAFQIVRAHRGRLFVESAVGVGSRFSFTLPRWSGAGPSSAY
jgi:histidine kinase